MNKAEFYDAQNERIKDANSYFLKISEQLGALGLDESLQGDILKPIAEEQDSAIATMQKQYEIDSNEAALNADPVDHLDMPWVLPIKTVATTESRQVSQLLDWTVIEKGGVNSMSELEGGTAENDEVGLLTFDELQQRVHDLVAENSDKTLGAYIAYALTEQPGRIFTEEDLVRAIYPDWRSGTDEYKRATHRVLNRYMYDLPTGIEIGLRNVDQGQAEEPLEIQFGKRWNIDENGNRAGSWARVCRAVGPGVSDYDIQPASHEDIWDAVGVAETIEVKPGEDLLQTSARRTGKNIFMSKEKGQHNNPKDFFSWVDEMRGKGRI